MYALVDCNNFFVSCERLFRPDLATKPVVVLSNNDGCFISRSQEAKDIGLPMGGPAFKFKQELRLHDVRQFSANFELYGDVSQRIVTVLRNETPLIEVYSIDECFMDISQLLFADEIDGSAHLPTYQQWAVSLRERIMNEVGIPVSVGVGPTKTLAKVASTYAKKHGGVYVVSDDAHREELLKGLAVLDVWGIGYRTAPKLMDKGVSTAWQLVSASDVWLRQQFNITGMRTVWELRGEPCIAFGDQHDTRKTIMRSRSFGHKVRDYYQLESAVSTFASQAAVKLRAQDSVVRHVVVFLSANRHTKDQPRVYLSKMVDMPEATADTARIITACLSGLEDIYDDQFAYQKAGVVLVGLVAKGQWQLSMLSEETRRDERSELMKSIDALNGRYGHVVYHASEKAKETSWHSKRDLRSPAYTTRWNDLPKLG